MFDDDLLSVAVIQTPSLCQDPAFNPTLADKTNMVVCRLIVPDDNNQRASYLQAIHSKQQAASEHQELSEDKNLVEHGADKLESDALLSSKEKQDTDILSLMNTLDVPDDVKDRLTALLKENADVFSEGDLVLQESELTHLGLEDAWVLVHDDL